MCCIKMKTWFESCLAGHVHYFFKNFSANFVDIVVYTLVEVKCDCEPISSHPSSLGNYPPVAS